MRKTLMLAASSMLMAGLMAGAAHAQRPQEYYQAPQTPPQTQTQPGYTDPQRYMNQQGQRYYPQNQNPNQAQVPPGHPTQQNQQYPSQQYQQYPNQQYQQQYPNQQYPSGSPQQGR